MNAIPKQIRDDIDIVARHYGLLEDNVKIMLDDALHAPIGTSQTYAAIVRSLLKEKK